MRIYRFRGKEIENDFIVSAIICSIVAIMSGIVLAIIVGFDDYFYNFADIYIFYVFNFKNGSLFGGRFLSELLFLYCVFFLVRATHSRYPALIFIFFRLFFSAFYVSVLFAAFRTEGALVAIFVFLPCSILSVLLIFITAFVCEGKLRPVSYCIPGALALLSSLLLLLVVNILFRAIVIIV